jgi:MFS family permease
MAPSSSARAVARSLADQLGRRRVALSALVLAAVCSAFYLAAPRWGQGWLFAGRTLSGLSVGVASGTATAWIAEFASGDRTSASVIAAAANFVGIAIGPLFAGALAQYAPAPLQLTHLVYLGLLAVTAVALATVPETVRHPVRRASEVSLRPRVGVPREIRSRFVSPAATMFAALALVGFYAALVPTILKRDLHQPNRPLAASSSRRCSCPVRSGSGRRAPSGAAAPFSAAGYGCSWPSGC